MPSRRVRDRQARVRRNAAALTVVAAVLAGGLWWAARGEPGDEPAAPTSQAAGTTSAPATKEAPGWTPTAEERQAATRRANELSLEELAGQLIVARHRNDAASLALVRDKHFAGVMVTSPQILDVTTSDPLSKVKAFNAELQKAGADRGYPVMVPIDQEGGLVARLRQPLTPFPAFMSAGAAIAGDPTAGARAVTEAARASGAELRAAGYNTVFAPDGDITIGAADPIIGSRSAGTDPQTVARAVVAAVTGYSQAGMISSVKHFPGHNVATDSHADLPLLASGKDRLRSHDLVPFKAAVAAAAPSIMTGHLNVSYVDAGRPASLSGKVVTDGLRKNLGFDGIIISDSLGMGAIMQRYPGGDASVEAIKAGSDLALMPADNDRAYAAVLAALRSGEIPEAQARASAARVIAYLMHADASPRLGGEPGSHAAESQALSAAALTLVDGPCKVTPVTSVRASGTAEAVASFDVAAKEAGLPTGSGTSVVFAGSRGVHGDVVVSTDRPYVLAYSSAKAKLALYGTDVPAMRALVAVLQGTAEPRGKLPVDGMRVREC